MSIFYGENDCQRIGTFSIVEVPPVKPGDQIQADDENWLFEDDSSLGSQFIALGIIHSALEIGTNLLLVFNPADRGDLK